MTVLSLVTLSLAAQAQADDFTLIAIPDAQYYTCQLGLQCASNLGIYESQTDWIADERDALDIRFVTSLGDCVENGNDPVEYRIAEQAYEILEGASSNAFPDGIPYGLAVGNHDQFPVGDAGSLSDPGDTTRVFNQYFGVDRFCSGSTCRDYYGDHYGDNNDNHYALFDANGYPFVVVHLEYMDRDDSLRRSVLDWADDVLTMYSDRRAIVVSHYVMDRGTNGPFSDQGEAIYEALKHHPNLSLILGGHVPGEGRRSDLFGGNTVHTLLADYQGRSDGGQGWLRILKFQPAQDQIQVETYSPWLDDHDYGSSSDFTLAYPMDGGHPNPQVAFQPGIDGYDGAVDTFLELGSGPAGDAETLKWDDSPEQLALVRFGELFESQGGPIPDEAPILRATLHYVLEDGGSDVDVHEVLVPWDETVEHATFGAAPGAQPGQDYVTTPLAQASGTLSGDLTVHTVDVTTSVWAWAGDPSANLGWIFVPSGTGGADVRSSDHPNPRHRPRLSVTWYAAPCDTDAECDDGVLCTADTCEDGTCRNPAIAGCCETDDECGDGSRCTLDYCDEGTNTCLVYPLDVCERDGRPSPWRGLLP